MTSTIVYNSKQSNFNKKLNEIEKTNNTVGYIPILNFGAAIIRAICGIAMMTFSGLSSIYYSIKASFISDKTKKFNCQNLAKIHFEYAHHGMVNLFRSAIEAIPILGGAALAYYDHIIKHRFEYKTFS